MHGCLYGIFVLNSFIFVADCINFCLIVLTLVGPVVLCCFMLLGVVVCWGPYLPPHASEVGGLFGLWSGRHALDLGSAVRCTGT